MNINIHIWTRTRISVCISSNRSDWGSLFTTGLLRILRA